MHSHWLYLIVFASDALIAFCSAKFYFALDARKRWHAVGWGAFLDFIINVNVIGMSQAKWSMMAPSLAGGALGVFFSMGLPRRKQDS
jgi:hypothetical protein